ncbi:MAG TPA: hypothetical protein VE127_05085, partial [Solirubrobacteraceae bacterium]|nr:hypothetical protein [Solirubrobacteraceae bacterium]
GALQMLPSGSMSSFPGPTPLELSDSNAVARVITRTAGGAVAASCADLVPVDLVLTVRAAHPGLEGVIAPGQTFQWPSSGRCAGPTAADLRQLSLPARHVGARSFSFAGRTTFGAGPFTVTAVSTLRAIVGRGSRPIAGPVPPPPRPPRSHHAFQESVNLAYRVVSAQGTLDTAFAGRPSPLCEPAGACGAHGELQQSLGSGGTVRLFASRVVRRRMGRSGVLRDLRQGRLRLQTSSVGQIPARVSETTTTAGGVTCTDTTGSVPLSLGSSASRHGGELQLRSYGGFFGGIDPLRTRCAGPSVQDVLGSRQVLGVAPIPRARLGAPTLSLTLGAGGAFTGPTYAGARTGAVALRLIRTHLSAGTQRIQVFGRP